MPFCPFFFLVTPPVTGSGNGLESGRAWTRIVLKPRALVKFRSIALEFAVAACRGSLFVRLICKESVPIIVCSLFYDDWIFGIPHFAQHNNLSGGSGLNCYLPVVEIFVLSNQQD